ncbi:hypothetical protein O6H91_22G050900 [Diphasiastrum complanatum]|uniref:Uncharacterized protein n=1 Tax=Diphasiastrum complanatum TaxID=34168 RepID=A0ACC2AFN2_DIPCM|nr:hypothetical protein O6H91_22G050900 [Diphasiastrum complanatum]
MVSFPLTIFRFSVRSSIWYSGLSFTQVPQFDGACQFFTIFEGSIPSRYKDPWNEWSKKIQTSMHRSCQGNSVARNTIDMAVREGVSLIPWAFLFGIAFRLQFIERLLHGSSKLKHFTLFKISFAVNESDTTTSERCIGCVQVCQGMYDY